MFKNKYFFLILISLFLVEISATGYITEVINNTGHAMTITSNVGGDNFHVVKSYSLENGAEIQLMTQNREYEVVLHPLSRNVINGLSMPTVNATHPSYQRNQLQHGQGLLQNFYTPSIVVKYFSLPPYESQIAFRQKGDLLEIIHDCCYGAQRTSDFAWLNRYYGPFWGVMQTVQIPSGKCLNLREVPQTLIDEKINNGNTYSIEINTHNSSGMKIIRNTIAPNGQRAKTARPIATIINFSETSPTTKAVVGFDRFVTDDFFNKFIKIIDNNDFFKRLSKMVTADLPTGRLLTFELYTHITKDEFQKIIDALNAQPL